MGSKPAVGIRGFGGIAVLAGLVFVSAGRPYYWQGWLFLAAVAAVYALTLWALRHSPGLIAERLHPGKGMMWWDKGYYLLSTPLAFAAVVVAALDAGRFDWGPRPSAVVYALALAAFIAGQGLTLWAKKINPFFSSVARLQSDRGQTVCREGPYRFCRHPGYLGGLLSGLATPLVLGSYWGLAPQVVASLLLVARTALEDRMLKNDLLWYAEYAETVPARLIPGLW
jgi:protein-S-isoprenylcysteine O-methyltransferase Ste14